jgi:hypothetical protein
MHYARGEILLVKWLVLRRTGPAKCHRYQLVIECSLIKTRGPFLMYPEAPAMKVGLASTILIGQAREAQVQVSPYN